MQAVPASVGAEIVLRQLDARTISSIRRALRYPNPEYIKARKGGEDPDVPPRLSACEELPGGCIRLPRGAIDAIRPMLHLRRVKPHWTDERSFGEPIDVQLHDIEPRPYQREAAELLRRHVQGMVVLPCGGGKTYTGIVAIALLGVSTLVVVPTRDLVDQWADDVRTVLHVEPAIFGTGKHDIGPITIATKDALSYHGELDLSRFGFVIYDEGHRIPAVTGQALLRRVPARYRLGLTATPEREDGLTKMVRWSFGPPLLQKTIEELVDEGFLVLPRVEAIHTSFDYSFPDDWDWKDLHALTDALAAHRPRRQTVLDLVSREPEQTWLLLSPSRGDLCWELAEEIRSLGITAQAVTSTKPPKSVGGKKLSRGKRRAIMDDFRAGNFRVLAATSLADEGLNIRHLSRIVFVLPEGTKNGTTQRLGRCMRPEGDAPIVYDLVDRNVDRLLRRWEKRKAVYRQLGLEIRECPTLSLFDPKTL